MYLINTTFQVDNGIADDFIALLRDGFIPDSTGCQCGVKVPVLTRIRPVEGAFDPDSTGIALQVRATDGAAFRRYTEESLPSLLDGLQRRWGMKVMFFTSVLDIIPLEDHG